MDIYNIFDVKDYPFELLNPEFEQIKYDNELKKLIIDKPIKFSYYLAEYVTPSVSYATFHSSPISLDVRDFIFDGPGHMGKKIISLRLKTSTLHMVPMYYCSRSRPNSIIHLSIFYEILAAVSSDFFRCGRETDARSNQEVDKDRRERLGLEYPWRSVLTDGEEVPKTVISPIKDYTSPNGVVNIINTFRREYKLPSKRERDDYVLVLNSD
ncbi:hypothetical protein RhiirA4_470399 [Rhizophagus irregularis]|uniref:Uncharacterized protein n=1 Tax=Rhizophagus irregularis TaxID=588596 RepID=A0A2I1H199_9GLOM|nr:hypothetical protein RhiirA4_470399 [Rhizophagus irregularis]